MRSRILVGAFLLLGVLFVGSALTTAAPTAKWAVIALSEPTLIAGSFASGPVLIEHDDGRMARGEPCTKVYQFLPGKGLGEKIVSFHCKPRWVKTVDDRFVLETRRNNNNYCVLLEYRFAGDAEAHGVPMTKR